MRRVGGLTFASRAFSLVAAFPPWRAKVFLHVGHRGVHVGGGSEVTPDVAATVDSEQGRDAPVTN